MTCIATTPRGGPHELQEVESRGSTVAPDARVVTRWCRNCGAVVVDLDMDGRTLPGEILKMRFPSIATKEAEG